MRRLELTLLLAVACSPGASDTDTDDPTTTDTTSATTDDPQDNTCPKGPASVSLLTDGINPFGGHHATDCTVAATALMGAEFVIDLECPVEPGAVPDGAVRLTLKAPTPPTLGDGQAVALEMWTENLEGQETWLSLSDAATGLVALAFVSASSAFPDGEHPSTWLGGRPLAVANGLCAPDGDVRRVGIRATGSGDDPDIIVLPGYSDSVGSGVIHEVTVATAQIFLEPVNAPASYRYAVVRTDG